MNQEVKKLWIDALRSGEYKQAKEALQGIRGFCCLGVLCELAVKAGVIPAPVINDLGFYEYQPRNAATLPAKVMIWADADTNPWLNSLSGSCADRNDNGYSFAEIANAIETDL